MSAVLCVNVAADVGDPRTGRSCLSKPVPNHDVWGLEALRSNGGNGSYDTFANLLPRLDTAISTQSDLAEWMCQLLGTSVIPTAVGNSPMVNEAGLAKKTLVPIGGDHGLGCNHDPLPVRREDHALCANACAIAAIGNADVFAPSRIIATPTVIFTGFSATGSASGGEATTNVAANSASSAGASRTTVPLRAWARNTDKGIACPPCRRTTPATAAPGCNASATVRAFMRQAICDRAAALILSENLLCSSHGETPS
ncbi:hypothetical protein KO516_00820 [Citreicella sp. C3M06]|uniref:hypothetical protein n=1 Tax=Citreicella sp. C3M06 TaxID=2841564 RepID=UPI001C0899DE|nr:hypothetical protein [Citreicella sp. C3M06]MBU2959382.1 hypothetical protein [Citreicella sp. C3M06]